MSLPDHSTEQLDSWFPDERPRPPEGTFELGLVLAGAVSAGAYTAGVLDFLYEALDAWHAAKARGDKEAPPHDVILRLITGASAGGMNGAISAVALRHDFPHPQGPGKAPDPGSVERDNPFWRAWVEEIDIRSLLETDDLKNGFPAFLNCTRLSEIVQRVIDGDGPPVPDGTRDWIADPLTVLMTVTNLRGVPYQIVFTGEDQLRHEMSLHRDHVAFAVPGLSRRPPGTPTPLAPDLVALPAKSGSADPAWRLLANSALATGAFPLFLEARRLERPGQHYLYRNFARDGGAPVYDAPAWAADGTPDPYGFLCVDGGTMNNEPFELARTALAGLRGLNPRDGLEACRAVVMVDPFADPGELGLDAEAPLPAVAAATLRALVNQARFSFRDRALIQDQDVYSRFMIAPRRSDFAGAKSLASGGLGAFLGFFSPAYRRHDFMLGRRNAQRFLEERFTLPRDNPLFKDWSPAMRERHRSRRRPGHLPVVPLVGRASEPERLPAWPAGQFRRDNDLTRAIHGRIDAVIDKVRDDTVLSRVPTGLGFLRPVIWPVMFGAAPIFLRRQLKKAAVQSLDQAVQALDEAA